MPHDDEDAEWNDSHRAFLQTFMARSTLTFEEVKPILSAISTVYGTRPSSSGTFRQY